ncbi:hypothetical protein ACTWQL_23735 [Pseudalkalibacillus sp. R45]|uniref:hypothetical protein n=1 Tax=Pseudalkalibacillus sp. R45 TaxID=3457433 RepID=UPI003FCEBBE8
MMEFLYFPEDKTEYIPSVIMLIIFMTAAIIATVFIRRHSAKELNKWENEEPNLRRTEEKVNESGTDKN